MGTSAPVYHTHTHTHTHTHGLLELIVEMTRQETDIMRKVLNSKLLLDT